MNFVETDFDKPMLEGLTFRTLDQSDPKALEEPFLDQEIKDSVWSCEGSKSPGPDGYNFTFIKNLLAYFKGMTFIDL